MLAWLQGEPEVPIQGCSSAREHQDVTPRVSPMGWHSRPCSWWGACPTHPSIHPKPPQAASGKEGPKHSPGVHGHLNPLDFGEVLHHLQASSQSPPCLDPGGQRKPKHRHGGINPRTSTFIQGLARSGAPRVTCSSEKVKQHFHHKKQRGTRLGSTLLCLAGKSRPTGTGGIGALLLGCSSSKRRACLAPRVHSAFFMVGCFSNLRNQAHPAAFLPHINHKDFIKMLLIVPKV